MVLFIESDVVLTVCDEVAVVITVAVGVLMLPAVVCVAGVVCAVSVGVRLPGVVVICDVVFVRAVA